MPAECLPLTVSAFLSTHGGEDLARSGLSDLPALTRFFRLSSPSADSDPLSEENLAFLTAVLDCAGIMNEQLYEHYRAMADLFREGILRAPRAALLAAPAFDRLRTKAVRLGFLPGDLYGEAPSLPHLGVPDAYLRIREVSRT